MYWSYVLLVVGVFGMLVIGEKKSWGWLIGVSAQVLWIVYGVSTKQYGFVLSALFYGGAYIRGYLKSRKPSANEINVEALKTEAYIRGLSDAGSTLRVYGEAEGLTRIITAIDTETRKVKPANVEFD